MGDTNIEWTETLKTRFWSYVDRRGPEECWPWLAGRFAGGMRYGQFRVGAKKVKAHRAAYELLNGKIPDGMRVLHRCDNPICCNSLKHHFIGTDADNVADRVAKNRSNRKPTVSLPGAANPAAKLALDAVRAIRRRSSDGESNRSIATSTGMSESQIGRIVRGQSWRSA